MLFNSFSFLIFFPLVTVIYFLLPHKFRWFHLLAASCYFYMAFVPVYILILFFTIIIDYAAGIMIENATGNARKRFLIMSLVANIGVLCVFKYYNFFIENADQLFSWSRSMVKLPFLNMILPIGLSFHTFQAMSYTIEVYRGNQKAERHFGIYALYVMFYPQLVAGPIERPQNILHQFHEKHEFNIISCKAGMQQMIWGFFKKIVIADRLAITVNNVYTQAHTSGGPELVLATVFFAFQIYCDFSGYSDIALGAAKIMGFNLMINFDHPFSSKSITEFWRRWHISLSTWFYDYLFNPIVLALRNWGKISIVFGLLFTFFLSGFWHGAGWKYIIYGLLNGVALVYEYFTKKQRKKFFSRLPKSISNGLSKVFTVGFISFSWIFFRANSVKDAFHVVSHLGKGWADILSYSKIKTIITALGNSDTLFGLYNIFSSILLIVFLEYIQTKVLLNKFVKSAGRFSFFQWGYCCMLVMLILLIGVFDNQEFIYFQF